MTGTSKDLAASLLASDAVQSLDMESRVVEELRKHSWRTKHSKFYKDPITQKLREIDISASKLFRMKRDQGPASLVQLVFECKSNADYSLVFNREDDLTSIPFTTRILKCDQAFLHRLWKARPPSYESILTKSVIQSMERYAYSGPNERLRIYPSIIFDLPAPGAIATSFRETKPKSERDADTSVLWRAIQSLMAFIGDEIERSFASTFSEMFTDLTTVNDDDPDTLGLMTMMWEIQAFMVEYFHPVVVTKSPIWQRDFKNSTMQKLPWIRLVVSGGGFWTDVVHHDHLSAFVSHTVTNYETAAGWAFSRMQKQEKYPLKDLDPWFRKNFKKLGKMT